MARIPAPARPRCSSLRLLRAVRVILPLVAATAIAAISFQGARGETGLPVPRFVSLRSDEVNLRTGPGTTYPVEWVYVRRHMPVEIIAEFDTWRKIRDQQGTVGWVHQSLLDGDRTGVVVNAVQPVLSGPKSDARVVARLEPQVIVHLLACRPGWCRIEVKGFEGWLRRNAFWGTYPDETFD